MMATEGLLALSVSIAVLLTTAVCFYLFHSPDCSLSNSSLSPAAAATAAATAGAFASSALSGTTGKLFTGDKVADYKGPRLFDRATPVDILRMARPLESDSEWLFKERHNCSNWAVVTTIFPPTTSVTKQAHAHNWCIVVVGDNKSPTSYIIPGKSNVVYLTVELQRRLAASFRILSHLPWNHFGRKNAGYLFAIVNGAQSIYDFDDDNCLIGKHHILLPGTVHNLTTGHVSSMPTLTMRKVLRSYEFHVFNPYPLFMPNVQQVTWPRGYPLDMVKPTYPDVHSELVEEVEVQSSSIGVVQYLANGDPDFDAIYRLTAPMPVDFPLHGCKPLLLPHWRQGDGKVRTVYTPFNAQTTLFLPAAYWALLLPVTVHGRVSDIWRAYIAQKLLAYINKRVAIHSPVALHLRNAHNYMADFHSEIPLYTQTAAFLQTVDGTACGAPTLAGCMEELFVVLHEHGFLGREDVALAQAWLTDLAAAGYAFPAIEDEAGAAAEAADKPVDKAAGKTASAVAPPKPAAARASIHSEKVAYTIAASSNAPTAAGGS